MKFKLRLSGREHTTDDPGCPGCESGNSGRWPRAHKEYPDTQCLGLVHAETFQNPTSGQSYTVHWCDTCNARTYT